MAYNDVVSRTGASATMPEDVANEIIKGVTNKSVAMQLFRHQKMTRAQRRLPVLNALPTAQWVTGDVGLKQTTSVNWTNVFLNAEELAVIVPIPENVLDDSDYDLWGEIRPLIDEAFAIALDGAVFFGTNKPASWPSDINTASIAASNAVTQGANTPDVGSDLNAVMSAVEADGYDANGWWIRKQFKGTLRNIRSTTGELIFLPGSPPQQDHANIATGGSIGTVWGETAYFSTAGLAGFAPGAGSTIAVAGDFTQGILGIRSDITTKVLDQAVITDNLGNIVFNLPQQDMVAMRFTARFAFAVPNPINRLQQTAAARYPFGVLRQ